jgi:hypothetical protein
MTDKASDAARQKLAEIRASLEGSQTVLELSPDMGDPEYVQAKQKALDQLNGALEALDLLAIKMGAAPAPVLH